MSKFKPVIKWSGSKRSQSENIIKYYPKKIKTYYEPFIGGGSMLMELMLSDIEVENFIVSDLNKDLINLWVEIKDAPEKVYVEYEKMWHEMNDLDDDKDRKKKYFYSIRKRYNKNKSPYDFMFVMRTTTNGMPRYNKNGEFNNSFHVTRNGIKPEGFKPIIEFWSELLNKNNVQFIHQSYEDVISKEGDFLYLDPPYANTKGMYFGEFENNAMWRWLRNQRGQYVLSYDGISGENDNTYSVPSDLYSKHEYMLSGNSPFKRVIGTNKDSVVYESLYIKLDFIKKRRKYD